MYFGGKAKNTSTTLQHIRFTSSSVVTSRLSLRSREPIAETGNCENCAPDKLEEIGSACAAITAHAFTQERLMRVRACGTEESVNQWLLPSLEKWTSELQPEAKLRNPRETNSFTLQQWSDTIAPDMQDYVNEFIRIPSQTNYVVRTFQTVPYAHPDTPKLVLLGRILSLGFLHREVREKGGAYGADASANSTSGTFTLSSYRDPLQLETLASFERAVEWAGSSLTAQDVEEAQLQCFKSLDSPTAPRNRGARAFGYLSLTDEMRQAFREQLLDANANDVMEVAHKYLGRESRSVDCIAGNASSGVSADGGSVESWSLIGSDLEPLRQP